MIIGNFAYDSGAETFVGSITTLTVCHDDVRIKPVDKKSDKEPDYRVVSESVFGVVEFGAAWKRTSDKGHAFISVALDDPLAGPINADLFVDSKANSATLVWNRKKKDGEQASASLKPAPSARSKRLKAA